MNIDIKINSEEEKQDLIRQLNKMKFSTEWRDIKSLVGYYVSDQSKILPRGIHREFQFSVNKNTFKTEKQAQSSVAKAMLSQLMAQSNVNGDWKPNWNNSDENKYVIGRVHSTAYQINHHQNTLYYFLCFKTEEIRQTFLDNYRDLIDQYLEI